MSLQEVWKQEKLANENLKGKSGEKPESEVVPDSEDDDVVIEEPPEGAASPKKKGKTIKKPVIASKQSKAERFR